jgi:hypothetical protein
MGGCQESRVYRVDAVVDQATTIIERARPIDPLRLKTLDNAK